MKRHSVRERLLASTMIGGAALAVLAAAPAYAADQPTTVEDVVVTGSRIPQPNLTQTSPVNTIGATDVKLAGTTRVEDVVNQLPQAFAAQNSTVSNGSSGTASVSLRGLAPSRTLVLIDGRRLGPGDPAAPTADLNNIPGPLVERIDVVTGGASAVYGSDAVAGVVNFIMKKNFEGLQIDINHSFYQHNNHDSAVNALVAARHATSPSQFNTPADNVTVGDQTDINITMGAASPDGKGNVEVYAGYRNIKPILQKDYDYSACSLSTSGSFFRCGGSGTASPPQFVVNGGVGFDGNGTGWVPNSSGVLHAFTANDQFNFAPYNFFQRPDERYTAGAFAHYEVNPMLDTYAQFMFMDDNSISQIAPSGIFGQNLQVNCDNPLLSSDEVSKFCGPTVDQDPATPGTQACVDSDPVTPGIQCNANLLVFKRNQEGGGRRDNRRHTDYRIVIGAKGDLNKSWSYDVYGQFGQASLQENFQNDFSVVRSGRALQVVNVAGVPTCKSVIDGTDPSCVPYNIFGTGPVTAAALNYLQAPGFQEAVQTEQVVSGQVTGKLGDYGIKSPWAEEGVGVALGAEYRREAMDFKTDLEFSSGDLAGQGGAIIGVTGAFDVKEWFAEARIPLIQNMSMAKDLSLDLGYRSSDYSSSGQTSTYKIEGNWSPINDIRFRASYNKAVRAPNIIELFTPAAVGLDGSVDPCAGSAPTLTQAQCANTGVSAAQYGHVLPNPAGQYNGFVGGNPSLKPEVGKTWSAGFVLTPSMIPGFNASFDYYDIKVDQTIGTIGSDTILTVCGQTGNPALCSLIHRQAGTGSLWLNPSGFVTDTNLNTGMVEVRGWDVQANYRFNLDTVGMADAGHLDFNLTGSELSKFHVQPLPGTTIGQFDCQGTYGPSCGATFGGGPRPKWRHKARMTWVTPWNINASLTWRHLGEVTSEANVNTRADYQLGSRDYFDLAGTWRVGDKLELRAGVNNIFDKDPPLIGSGHLNTGPLNGNTAPGTYDSLGRFVFMGLTAKF